MAKLRVKKRLSLDDVHQDSAAQRVQGVAALAEVVHEPERMAFEADAAEATGGVGEAQRVVVQIFERLLPGQFDEGVFAAIPETERVVWIGDQFPALFHAHGHSVP